MSLTDIINTNRKEIITDSYEMSIGEIMNLYKEGDLIISPEYQRLFRWTDNQKTNFIESILLWFPVPSFFVYQLPNGTWELIDGLQRLSTIFQFAGILKDSENKRIHPLTLNSTDKIEELSGVTWKTLDENLQRDFKRARIRVEILKSTSDKVARYELFQRLNTGGSILTPQEVRNCTISMINPYLLSILQNLTENPDFINTIDITADAKKKAYDTELILRFFSYAYFKENRSSTDKNMEIHEYLNKFAIYFSKQSNDIIDNMADKFATVFNIINTVSGKDAFKKKNGDKFYGQFLLTKYEVITYGIFANLDSITTLDNMNAFIKNKIINVDEQKIYQKYSGSGVRASSRLGHLLSLGETFFKKKI